jgi:hypothetical protein
LQGVVEALQGLQVKLTTWGAEEFGNLARIVQKLRQKLERLRLNSVGRGPTDGEWAVVKKLWQALHQEEIWIRQCSRVLWLIEGDINTSYFRTQAAQWSR